MNFLILYEDKNPVVSWVLIVREQENKSAKYSIKLCVREEGGYIYMKLIALYLKQGWIMCLCVMVKHTINIEDIKNVISRFHQIIQESC